MPVGMRVPVQEGDVLGGDFNESGAVFHQAPCQQTTTAKATGVVNGLHFGWFLTDVKRFAFFGT